MLLRKLDILPRKLSQLDWPVRDTTERCTNIECKDKFAVWATVRRSGWHAGNRKWESLKVRTWEPCDLKYVVNACGSRLGGARTAANLMLTVLGAIGAFLDVERKGGAQLLLHEYSLPDRNQWWSVSTKSFLSSALFWELSWKKKSNFGGDYRCNTPYLRNLPGVRNAPCYERWCQKRCAGFLKQRKKKLTCT